MTSATGDVTPEGLPSSEAGRALIRLIDRNAGAIIPAISGPHEVERAVENSLRVARRRGVLPGPMVEIFYAAGLRRAILDRLSPPEPRGIAPGPLLTIRLGVAISAAYFRAAGVGSGEIRRSIVDETCKNLREQPYPADRAAAVLDAWIDAVNAEVGPSDADG